MIESLAVRGVIGGLLYGAVLALGCWMFNIPMSFQDFMICVGVGVVYAEIVLGPRRR